MGSIRPRERQRESQTRKNNSITGHVPRRALATTGALRGSVAPPKGPGRTRVLDPGLAVVPWLAQQLNAARAIVLIPKLLCACIRPAEGCIEPWGGGCRRRAAAGAVHRRIATSVLRGGRGAGLAVVTALADVGALIVADTRGSAVAPSRAVVPVLE
jgi:hypothetical protein